MEKQTEKVPTSLIVLAGILILLSFYFAGFGAIIGAIIGIACARKCYGWSTKVGEKGNFAFFVGFFMGLIGLAIYWFYYKYKMAKDEKSRATKKAWFMLVLIFGVIIWFFIIMLIFYA